MKILKVTKDNADKALQAIYAEVRKSLPGGNVEVELKRPSKKRSQESKYHCLINDIAETVTLDGRRYSVEVWKAKLVEDFAHEKQQMGEPLSRPGEVTLSLDGLRLITVRPSTTDFRASEANEFIEYLYAKGTEYGATFTDPSTKYYEEVMARYGIKDDHRTVVA